jgi:hypothetical protein
MKTLKFIILSLLFSVNVAFAAPWSAAPTTTTLSASDYTLWVVGGVNKTITLNYTEALLKTYFDTLYQPKDSHLTSLVSPGNWKLLYTDGSGIYNYLALGASNTYLQSNGVSSAPAWASPSPMVYPGSGVPVSTGSAWTTSLNITGITDSTSTTSSTIAGSATGVKAAYDLANGKQTASSNLSTVTTPGTWKVFYTDGSSVLQALALGGANTYLQSNGASAAPTWVAPGGSMVYPGGTGIPQVSGGTSWGTTLGTVGSGTNVALATSPAFTTDIHPATAGNVSNGTAALPWGTLYIGTAATNNYIFTPAAAGAARIINIPDIGATGNLPLVTATGTTAGQIPMATATAGKFTLSTPTYPSTSQTSRKILVSDGTNFVASTELWPIATSNGNMMVANGTDWVTTASTGSGSPVRGTSPALTTPDLTGETYQTYTTSSTASGMNLDSSAYADFNYSNGGSAAAYTPAWTNQPASGKVRYITLTLGGGAGIVTTTWTNVTWMGTAGQGTTTANKKSTYACIVPSSGSARCSIVAEAY